MRLATHPRRRECGIIRRMKRQMAKVAAAVMAAALAGEAFALREISFMTAMPAKSAPVIDGAVDDACWKDGVAEVVVRFAADDLTGSMFKRWQVEAEELSSGMTCSSSWKLKH